MADRLVSEAAPRLFFYVQHLLGIGHLAGEPPVVGLASDLQYPARHRDGDSVGGELAHERVEPFPGRFACERPISPVTPVSSASANGVAQANTAWKITNSSANRIGGPTHG